MIAIIVMIAQIVSSAPPLSPEQAVAVLRTDQLSSDVTDQVLAPWPAGPRVVVMPSSPTAGPFGEFGWFAPALYRGWQNQYWSGGRSFRNPGAIFSVGPFGNVNLPFAQTFVVDPSPRHGGPQGGRQRGPRNGRR